MERLEPAVRLLDAEQLQRLRLGRRGEREGGEVRQGAALLHLGEDRLLQFLFRRRGFGFLLFGRLEAPGGEHRLEALRTLAGLGGVRFVDDDREPLAGKRSDLLGDHRELLERRDDDPLAGFQRRAELLRILVDLLDHPERLLELGDGALKLAVQHAAVRDDDDGIEHRAIIGVVQRGELVREPRDRVALAAPGGVLDQVALPRPVVPGVGHHAPDGIELLVTREDQTFRLLARVVLVLHFVDELPDQIEDAVPGPDFFPQVVRGVPALGRGDGRIAGAAELAAVEGQEAGLGSFESRGDVHQIGVHREVREATPMREERFARIAIMPDTGGSHPQRSAR